SRSPSAVVNDATNSPDRCRSRLTIHRRRDAISGLLDSEPSAIATFIARRPAISRSFSPLSASPWGEISGFRGQRRAPRLSNGLDALGGDTIGTQPTAVARPETDPSSPPPP